MRLNTSHAVFADTHEQFQQLAERSAVALLGLPVPQYASGPADADYLAASLGLPMLGRPQPEIFTTREERLLPPAGPSATALVVALSVSLLAEAPTHSRLREDGRGSAARANHYFQVVSARMEDKSLSSETPLPPASPKIWGEEEEQAQNEIMEFMDEEIEIIDSSDKQSSNVLAESEGEENGNMALTSSNIKENLTKLEGIEGFIGAALADSDSGMCIGFIGGAGVINLEVAAAANTEVVRSKRKAMKSLNLRDELEDMLISLGKQYHLIRPVRSRPSLFYYVALDRQRANLALARFALADTERELPL